MKKILALIFGCLILCGIGYGLYYITKDRNILVLFIIPLLLVVSILFIGAVYWFLDYIGKN